MRVFFLIIFFSFSLPVWEVRHEKNTVSEEGSSEEHCLSQFKGRLHQLLHVDLQNLQEADEFGCHFLRPDSST